MSCPTVLCSIASGSQAFNLLQHRICRYHQLSANLKLTGMKGKWLRSALLIELHWPFSNNDSLKRTSETISNYSVFFHWEGCRVQSTLFHLDGNVKEVIVAFTPTKLEIYFECRSRKIRHKEFKPILCYKLWTYTYTDIFLMTNNFKRLMREDKCSHGLSFFPRLSPDVDTMSADKDRTWIWVFLHC